MTEKFEFVTKHFLIISAALTAVGAVFSLLFAFGYLLVFDRSLIWIIEYSDLIKFVLIFIVFISASAGYMSLLPDDVKILSGDDKKKKNALILGIILVGIIVMSVSFYANFKSGDYVNILGDFVWYCVFLLLILFSSMINNISIIFQLGGTPSFGLIFSVACFVIACLPVLGMTYGFSVKSSKKTNYQIVTKDKSNFENVYYPAKMILILSHHTIFEYNSQIVVVPSADVTRIISPTRE